VNDIEMTIFVEAEFSLNKINEDCAAC